MQYVIVYATSLSSQLDARCSGKAAHDDPSIAAPSSLLAWFLARRCRPISFRHFRLPIASHLVDRRAGLCTRSRIYRPIRSFLSVSRPFLSRALSSHRAYPRLFPDRGGRDLEARAHLWGWSCRPVMVVARRLRYARRGHRCGSVPTYVELETAFTLLHIRRGRTVDRARPSQLTTPQRFGIKSKGVVMPNFIIAYRGAGEIRDPGAGGRARGEMEGVAWQPGRGRGQSAARRWYRASW